ncbi:FtsK/SpoIIIE domain-containing protein [Niallia sp. FSL W8-1348]|uniref:FtsK/SpoIIIE domain-containing protein n=1 Tax=Niallia sp. FSL W8-1348 TaxID=2954656 RepID=UPI0030FABE21
MLELLTFPLAILAVAFLPRVGEGDDKKISRIMKNIGYGIRGKEGELKLPKYKGKQSIVDDKETIGTTYLYSVPLGLPASKMRKIEEDIKLFTDGLKRPVEIEFNKLLMIHVFNKELPTIYEYKHLPSRKGWVVPIGMSLRGIIWHNFDHTPHMTAAGTTRFGKTVFLRMMMTYLIEHHQNDVEFYVIDLKGGLEFSRYQVLQQVKEVASDIYEASVLLSKLQSMFAKDYEFFRKNNYSNVVDTKIKKRRFIIVDEAAQLAPDKFHSKQEKQLLSYCQGVLSEIARVAGALGYRLIYATQYPTADTMPRQIKQNADAKISFRLPSGYASKVAIDDVGAEELPSNIKGRAIFKTHELRELQAPFISHEEMWKRLEKYQEPKVLEVKPNDVVEHRTEETAPREDLVKFE